MNSVRSIAVLLAVLVGVISLTVAPGNAQERWSKVRINVPDRESLHELMRMGVNFQGSRGGPGGRCVRRAFRRVWHCLASVFSVPLQLFPWMERH